MNTHDLTQNILYFVALIGLAIPLGAWIARVWEGRLGVVGRILGPVERGFYRVAGIKSDQQMDWKQYALALLLFSFLCFLGVFIPVFFQNTWMPFNADQRGPLHTDALQNALTSFNIAVSFITNTNWQGYAGESAMSHFVQMAALAVQNFLSAAVGLGVLAAIARGLSKKSLGAEGKGLGNFWVDITRATLYVLLPVAFVFALILVSQGVIQNFHAGVASHLVEGGTRVIAQGPVASQEAIKMIGTNGGGFFNANSAHPYENPTPLTNFLETIAILLIPAAQCLAFGKLVLDRRQGVALLATMTVVLVACLAVCNWSEYAHVHPAMSSMNVDTAVGNMEGKELRFGVGPSTLFATATTAASCGAVNSMHDSYAPLAGMMPLGLMQVGEVIFGGVGSGLYGMIHFVILTVFIAGLMVGRTPEYLGKKVGAFEMKCAVFALLIPNIAVLVATAIACVSPGGLAGLNNPGAHGFSEILYAATSASNNNGSAFAGLSVETNFYNILLGICMIAGRFGVIIPTLMMAGSLAKRASSPPSAGTLPTHTWLFSALLICIVVIMGALTFLPALALGPIAEHVSVFVK